MRLGLISGYSGAQMGLPMDTILEAERVGFDSVWTAEAYGSDAVTPLAWIGALTKKIRLGTGIMQMPARTPAATAMTAMTLDALSGGRFILGIGPSGPQVVEGWHGVPYGKPLQRTREYIEIVRTILAREVPVEHHGKEYRHPVHRSGRVGARQAAQEHPARAQGHADLHRVDQPQGNRARGGNCRRRDSGLDESGTMGHLSTRRSSKASRRPAAKRASTISTSRRSSPASWARTSSNAGCR